MLNLTLTGTTGHIAQVSIMHPSYLLQSINESRCTWVAQVRLHTDKATGRSKGYAHIHFPDEASLEKAVAMNGMDFYGRNLKVGFAQKKRT